MIPIYTIGNLLVANQMNYVVSSGGTPYSAKAVSFDGSSTYLLLNSNLSGITNTSTLIYSVWVKFSGNDSAYSYLQWDNEPSDNTCGVLRTISNNINIFFSSPVTVGCSWTTTTTYTTSTTWHHIAFCWNGTGVGSCYIDGVAVTGGVLNPGPGAYSAVTQWVIGGTNVGNYPFYGSMSDFYMNTNEYLDLSVAANLAKFRSGTGHPVYLGSTGQLPTGNSPILFLTGDNTHFYNNLGTGGGTFTVNGILGNDTNGP